MTRTNPLLVKSSPFTPRVPRWVTRRRPSPTSADYQINPIISVDLGARYVDNLYADHSIANSAFLSEDNLGAVKLPSCNLIDLGTTRFELMGMDANRINVNNLLDTSTSQNQTRTSTEDGSDTWNGVDARNFVWFGFRPLLWNASLSSASKIRTAFGNGRLRSPVLCRIFGHGHVMMWAATRRSC